MPDSVSFRTILPALLTILMLPRPAIAASTLAEAIKQADSKYLGVKDVPAQPVEPKIEAGGAEGVPSDQEISKDNVRATLGYRESKTDDGEIVRVPVVSVFTDSTEVAGLEGEESFMADPPVSLQLVELERGNRAPETVVSFFTGGAHCCSDTKILTSNNDGSGWRVVEVGQFDGGPLLATDLAGDGHPVFQTVDNAFLYAFGCYACSTAPLKILGLEDGKIKDVTTEPRFRPAHEAHLKAMISDVPDEEVNGFLAGYVAEKSLLGEGKEAWEIMLAHYDKASDWGLDSCDKPLDDEGNCPGKSEKLSFPGALERMLNENGYKIEK